MSDKVVRPLLSKVDWYAEVGKFCDLATSKHIEDDPNCVVVGDMLAPYRELLGSASQWGHATTDPAGLRGYLLEQGYAVEYADDTVVIDVPDGRQLRFYVYRGRAWYGVRGKFEGVIDLFGDVMSFDGDAFAGPLEAMRQVVARLMPVEDPAGQMDLLLRGGLPDAGGADSVLGELQGFSANWGAYSDVSRALDDWDGLAAEIFKGAYVDLIPSILTGQTLVAKVLTDSLEIVSNAYRGLRTESLKALLDAVDIMTLYPARLPVSPANADWALVLNVVAGVAGTISGVTGFQPGPGTVISVAAALVAGTASMAATVIGSPEHTEAVAKPVTIVGDTAAEIVYGFEELIRVYRNTVINTEEVLKRVLAGFQSLVEDTSAPGATVRTTWGSGTFTISRRNTFFVTKPPALGSIDAATGYGTISDSRHVGTPPREGEPFAADLQQLLRSGKTWLPQLAGNYRALTDTDPGAGVDLAFTRSVHGYSVGESHGYATSSHGELYPQWIALHEEFTSMLAQSGENLELAAAGLVAAANAYAEQDAEARKRLEESSDLYEGN